MPKMMARIRKWPVTENLPPQGAIPAGQVTEQQAKAAGLPWPLPNLTPEGKQLWFAAVPMVKAVPRYDEKGKREYAKNPMTAEPLYPKNRPEKFTWHRLFYLEDQGNGNNTLMPYVPETSEERARRERQLKIKSVNQMLAETLVDEGIDSPEALRARLVGSVPDATNPVYTRQENPPVEPQTYTPPEHLGAGWWLLADGSKMRGDKIIAEEKQRRIFEARVDAAASPEQ